MLDVNAITSLTSAQLRAVHRIQQLTAAIAQNNLRLTTEKRINSAQDDPSGLVRAELLRAELSSAQSTLDGLTLASELLSTADTAAGQILSNLQQARTLALQAASGTLSSSQLAANQAQIDTILASINSLAQTTFNSQRLLDGSADFTVSGYDPSQVLRVEVLDKQTDSDVTISMTVTQQARRAHERYTGGTLASDTTLAVTGPWGSATITLSSGDTTQDIEDAFNAVAYQTGIQATRVDATNVDLDTIDYGSSASITIQVLSGSFSLDPAQSQSGQDAVATINGQSVTADGTTFSYVTSQLNLEILLDPSASGTLTDFTVSGDGLEFVVGTDASVARIGLPDLSTSGLGSVLGRLYTIGSGQSNSLASGNAVTALQIIDAAIAQVTRAQAKIGSFQSYTIESSSNVLDALVENTADAISDIEDADLATETALLANNQTLLQTAYQALSITSLSSQNVLTLLEALVS